MEGNDFNKFIYNFFNFLKRKKDKNTVVILYSCLTTISFNEFADSNHLKNFIKACNPSMIYIKDIFNNINYDVYKIDFKKYIEENNGALIVTKKQDIYIK